MNVRFRAAALADLAGIVEWYEENAPSLVPRFEAELGRLVARLERTPLQFPLKYRTVRQALFPSLPYRLFFVVRHSRVQVLAVLHQARDPSRWP